jgi:prepilin-type N-terminal cleavage/methylation domain-containing protein/prepilin-type processing-associated H-X9-DG protein
MREKHKNGFTLVELLITIVIIVILSAIAVPVSLSIVEKSRQATCVSNLRQIGVGLQMYLGDHRDILPELALGRESKTSDVPVLETVLLGYVESEEVFHCPSDKKEFKKTGCSYLWNITQNGRSIDQLSFFGNDERPERIPLVSDKEGWHDGKTNFLYADFSMSDKVRFVTTE